MADCTPDDLHQALEHVFEGEWGPTSVDTITRMLNSGIEVFLAGRTEYLPLDPHKFIEELKKKLGR